MNTCEVGIDAGKALQGEDSINVGITFSRQNTTTPILRMKVILNIFQLKILILLSSY